MAFYFLSCYNKANSEWVMHSEALAAGRHAPPEWLDLTVNLMKEGINMSFNLKETASKHIVLVAHRGAAGGNIPCNTMASYEIALKQGSDMIETDVDVTADGVLVIFHPGMEKHHLCIDRSIHEMTYDEVRSLRYVNTDDNPTQFGLLTFDELLENFKDRCYINVDKYWDNPQKIYAAIKRHGMIDQVLVKSSLSERVLQVLEELSPELAFMPIVREEHPLHESLMARNINYVGAEVLFRSDESPVASSAFIDRMHRDGKLVWVNSIIYSYKEQLSAGHSDDTALTASMDDGWGWLAARGFDMIQTDWTQMLADYLKTAGKYYK